jgi:hypothetical protein
LQGLAAYCSLKSKYSLLELDVMYCTVGLNSIFEFVKKLFFYFVSEKPESGSGLNKKHGHGN